MARTENEQLYHKQKHLKSAPLWKGVTSLFRNSLWTGAIVSAVAIATLISGIGPLLAIGTALAAGVGVIGRAIQRTVQAYSARSRFNDTEAELQQELGRSPNADEMGNRLRENGAGSLKGVLQAWRAGVVGEEKKDARDKAGYARMSHRSEARKGLEALGFNGKDVTGEKNSDIADEHKKIIDTLKDRIVFEKVGGQIDPMRFSIRLTEKDLENPVFRKALEELRVAHYAKFIEAQDKLNQPGYVPAALKLKDVEKKLQAGGLSPEQSEKYIKLRMQPWAALSDKEVQKLEKLEQKLESSLGITEADALMKSVSGVIREAEGLGVDINRLRQINAEMDDKFAATYGEIKGPDKKVGGNGKAEVTFNAASLYSAAGKEVEKGIGVERPTINPEVLRGYANAMDANQAGDVGPSTTGPRQNGRGTGRS